MVLLVLLHGVSDDMRDRLLIHWLVGLLSVLDDFSQFLVDQTLVGSLLLSKLSLVQLLESLYNLLMAVARLLLLMMLFELPQSVGSLLLVDHVLAVLLVDSLLLVSDSPLFVSWTHLPHVLGLSLMQVLLDVVLSELIDQVVSPFVADLSLLEVLGLSDHLLALASSEMLSLDDLAAWLSHFSGFFVFDHSLLLVTLHFLSLFVFRDSLLVESVLLDLLGLSDLIDLSSSDSLVLDHFVARLPHTLNLLEVVLWLPWLDFPLVDHNRLVRSLSHSGPLSDDLMRTSFARNMRCLRVMAVRLALKVVRNTGMVLLQLILLLGFDRLVLLGIFFLSFH